MENKNCINENTESINQNDDEISLIDLFSVLIKYRKLIIIGTLSASILFAIYLFIVPLFTQKTEKNYICTYTASITPTPSIIQRNIDKNISSLLAERLEQPTFIAKVYKKAPLDKLSSAYDTIQYSTFINDKIIKEKILTYKQTNTILTLTMKSKNTENATKLANIIFEDLNNYLAQEFPQQIINLINTTQDILNKNDTILADSTTIDTSSYNELLRLLSEAKEYTSNSNNNYLNTTEEPFIIEEPQGRNKKSLICFFASFFVFIFISFSLNAISNIKKDSDSMTKIHDAWISGK